MATLNLSTIITYDEILTEETTQGFLQSTLLMFASRHILMHVSFQSFAPAITGTCLW